jgi:hypothetical protein
LRIETCSETDSLTEDINMPSIVYSQVTSRQAKNNVDMAVDLEYDNGEEVEEAILPGIFLKIYTF